MSNNIYDIRSSECATHTLVDITGVPRAIWDQYLSREGEYEYIEYLVEDAVQTYGHLPHSYKDLDFVFFHVTTSANQCTSYSKHGLLNLKQAYLNEDSELKKFLAKHNIHIDLDAQTMIHNGKDFDISYGAPPMENTEAYYRWELGRKFFYDYTICGFLSVSEECPYDGQVHRRPEILKNIDRILRLQLSREWARTHIPYEITLKVNGQQIVYDGDDAYSEKDKIIYYLTKAYLTAFGGPSEIELLLQNNIQIPPSDILDIRPLSHWLSR